MTPEEAAQVADEILIAHTGRGLTDIQRMILEESTRGKKYEEMEGSSPQHIKNEGQNLWKMLTEALGEEVKKTNFKHALEKRLKSSDEKRLIPPTLLTYSEETWVGRNDLIDTFLSKLEGQTRILLLTGISGIGKSALGECLAAKAWEKDRSFQWVYLEIRLGQTDFCDVAPELLTRLGDIDVDCQLRNDPDLLAQKLVRKLQSSSYWLQLDSLENLINKDQSTETKFADPYWATFSQRCLTEPNFSSRLVLTSQAFPQELQNFSTKYSNIWAEHQLKGLWVEEQAEPSKKQVISLEPEAEKQVGSLELEADQYKLACITKDYKENLLVLERKPKLEFFTKRGLESTHTEILAQIAKIYEGHPTVLKVIAENIKLDFGGNVETYWESYQQEFEQVARELNASYLSEAEYNDVLNSKVRERLRKILLQLPKEAKTLLLRSSVFRRPVPKKFWLALINDQSPQKQTEAYQVLADRALIEKEGGNIRQHNLIRDIGYNLLRENNQDWQEIELKAGDLWCKDYQPATNCLNLEKVRGYLEALNHYCQAEAWQEVKNLFTEDIEIDSTTRSTLRWQLDIWGYYREEIILCKKVLGKCGDSINIKCWKGIGDGYLNLSDYDKASEAYKKSLYLARKIKDSQSEANALENLGLVCNHLGNYKEAIDYFKAALNISSKASNAQDQSSLLINLSLTYNKIGDYRQAIDSCQQALSMLEKDDFHRKSNALGNLGTAYANLGEYKQAIDCLEEVLSITEKTGNLYITCQVLVGLATLYSLYNKKRDIKLVKEYLNRSFEIAKETGDRECENKVLGALCNVYSSYKEHISTKENTKILIQYYDEQLEIIREIKDRGSECIVLNRLGSIHQEIGDYSKSIESHQQSLNIAREIGDRQSEGLALMQMGLAELKQKQYLNSLEHSQESLRIFEEIGDQQNRATSLKNLGEIHYALGKVENAKECYEEALKIADKLGIERLGNQINALLQKLS